MNERVLSGRYILGDQIGSGGMAIVFQAWDRDEQREVAVKVLRSEYNEDEEFVRRFNMEAQAASKMSHPNIVKIYGVGQDMDMRYIVMEYVKGRTLKEVIRQAGRIKPERAVQITLKILAAVDCAHRNHVIHRDIKPQNILVDVEGNVKVADFGIARATNASTQTYTEGGNVLGSVHYFSPEQASGQVADEKSDLYSVGVVLFEMVTGEVPFDGETPISIALKHVQEPPRSARMLEPAVSKGLDEVILKSLDKEASCRYQTATDMARDLKHAIRMPRGGFVDKQSGSGKRIKEKLKGVLAREDFWKRARLWAMVLVSALVMTLGVYYGSSLYRYLFVRFDMPNFLMMDVEDAAEYLGKLELEYTLDKRHNEDVRYGNILEQYPAAGEAVWPGDRVKLVMSTGKEKLMMPKLLDQTRSEAVRIIEENDLVLGTVELKVAAATPGTVVAQNPSVNEWVKPGDKVNLSISGESAKMPDLSGYTLEEAKGLLIASGFELGNVSEAISEAPAGLIIDQSVEAETVALMGEKIHVTVSQSLPKSCRAQTTIVVQAPEKGVEVVCTLVETSGEREVYRKTLSEGQQEITLDLDTLEPGTHT
ncbi:MAG: protein kinase, partial [Clostridia bacterium]